MDWIVEKAVELGVGGLQPLAARRSVVKLSAERAEKRSGALAGCGGGGFRAERPQPPGRRWRRCRTSALDRQQDLHKRVLC
jgi:16S rRNA (uracil1498-N3)-methyltransferase